MLSTYFIKVGGKTNTNYLHDRIAVIDFGGQYAHLIATKVRRLGVLGEIRQPDDSIKAFYGYKGIILSGSPALASGEDDGFNKKILDLPIPILGFCFGHQEIAKHYGGRVEHCQREYGPAKLKITGKSPIFNGVPAESTVWMSHGDTVTALSNGLEEIGVSYVPGDKVPHVNAAIAYEKGRRYGLQFHPEVDDTEYGQKMLENFVIDICGCRPSWSMDHYLDDEIKKIRKIAGNAGVFLLISGGVDSTVAAKIIAQAIGKKKLYLLHIDTGLMRKDESRQVIESLKKLGLSENLHFVDASREFLSALKGLVDPEKKRHAIGETFIRVFEREANRAGLSHMLLGQGTIYPDTIETRGTSRADLIKTHHNRVPLIDKMIKDGRVVEPLRELYKFEVRELGKKLRIPSDLIWRHPFPGPGLGIRLLCSDGKFPPEWKESRKIQTEIDKITKPESLKGTLMPIRNVGVKADLRSFEMPVLIQGDVKFNKLLEMAARLYKNVSGINRAVLDLSLVKINSIEPRAATVAKDRLELLREADNIVTQTLREFNLYEKIWQCPTILVPLIINKHRGEYVIIRPIESTRGMTARPAQIPLKAINKIRSVLKLPNVIGLGFDISTKPPGTIEWE